MPLLQSGSVSWNLYSTIITFIWIWTRAVAADDANGVYVYANQTSDNVFTLTGDWTSVTSLDDKWTGGTWLNGTHADGATTPTTLSYKFNGTTFVVFGSVVDGSAGSTMALNVKIDDDLTSPAYQPKNVTDGVDPSYQLYTNTSLASTIHTFTLEITGETSPFLLLGVYYIPMSATHDDIASTTPSPTETAAQNSSSNDTAKLGGAIGGGLGALLLVGLIILFMMRRIRKVESEEKQLAARPFVSNPGTTRSVTGTSRNTPSASVTALNTPMTRKKEPSLPSTSSATPLKRPLPSSSNSAPSSHANTIPPYSPPSAPHRSPVQSIISVPSEYQATTVGAPGGTAVASSYIGTTPLPDLEGAPPVPEIPADVKRKSKATSKVQSPREPQTPSSGLGLFSSDSVNSIGTTSSGLARPLPIVPGTRSSAPSYSFPPEKVGLTPAPPRREASTSKRKKPRPLPGSS